MTPDTTVSQQELRSALGFLAFNLRSTWDAGASDVFKTIDRDLWARVRRNPVAFLNRLGGDRLESVAGDERLVERVMEARADLESYLDRPVLDEAIDLVAYFSPEFGVAEFLPTYSGGLGILAGDHLKAASDLGVPLVGVGLLYGEGYFRQALDESGWQQESYPRVDPSGQPLSALSPKPASRWSSTSISGGARVAHRCGSSRSVESVCCSSIATSKPTIRKTVS